MVGLLWYDDNPGRDLAEKVGRAVRRYRQKFSEQPNMCYVHPSALAGNGDTAQVAGVEVSAGRVVLRHHFWVGVEEAADGRT